MDFEALGKKLAGLAPTVAGMLGGPLAAAGANALLDFFGIKPDAPDAQMQVNQALTNMTADQAIALKKLDDDLKAKLIDASIQLEQISASDRASARQREISLKDRMVPTLAVMIVASFIGMVAATLLGVSKVDSALAGTLVGYLSAKCELVIAYYFGSSAGSDRKTELMAASSAKDAASLLGKETT